MKPPRRALLLLSVCALAALLAGAWLAQTHGDARHDRSAVAALFASRWPDVQGRTVDLGQMRGRILVVNFWAPWCPPCVEEIPLLNRLAQRWQSRGVKFIGIGVDTPTNIGQFLEKTPTSYLAPVAGFAAVELSRELGNTAGGLPFTVIIDQDERIYRRITGKIAETDIVEALSALNVQPRP